MRQVIRVLVLAWVGTVVGCGGNARVDESPKAAVEQVKSAAELRKLMDGGNVMLVHSLDAANYEKGHVPGAVHIDYEKMTAEMLPPDKGQTIVFYCVGGMCPVGRMAASRAAAWGYLKAMVYEGGMKDWEAAGMKVATGK